MKDRISLGITGFLATACIIGWLGGIVRANTAPSGPVTAVKVPCLPDSVKGPGAFLRKCSDVIQGGSGTLSALDSQVKNLIDAPEHSLYRGENPDPNAPDPDHPRILNFGKPVCDPVPNPFNGGSPEVQVNHLHESCGAPARFDVKVSTSGIDTTMYMSGPYGTMEASYLRGSWIQALTCHWQEVRHEISSQGMLRITPSCAALAGSVQKLGSGSIDVTQQLTDQIGGAKNAADLWKCDGSPVKVPEGDATRVQQSAQQLCAARSSLESLFSQLAMCEVITRADRAYRALAQDPDGFIDELKHSAVKACNDQCSAQCRGCVNGPTAGAAERCSTCGTSCANQCYPNELRKFYAEKMKVWPNTGSCAL